MENRSQTRLNNRLSCMVVKWMMAAIVLVVLAPVAEATLVHELKVMTFNVWSGEDSASGRAKLVEIMQAGGADIIGLQEVNASVLDDLANAMGYHYHQQSGGDIQIISRYPIVGQSPNNLGVRVEVSADQHVWVFNAHLAPYPYQPYDLRDGTLAMNEAAVIAAANASRGSQVTTFLNDMAGALNSGEAVFFTGDFNEPSHLDWTQAAADATSRPFDLEVEYPASKRITDEGFFDAFRAVRPDEVNDPAYTWTPGYPPPNLSSNEVHDRIDIIYGRGEGLIATDAFTIGLDAGNISTDLGIAGFNADHRAVVATFSFAPEPSSIVILATGALVMLRRMK